MTSLATLNLFEATLLLSVTILYIVNCPFNKVEESFNTQAVHDFVNLFPYKLPSNSSSQLGHNEIAIRAELPWDHIHHPGVVPRTFVGSMVIGMVVKLVKSYIISAYKVDDTTIKDDHDLTAQFILQITARLVLASFVVLSLLMLLRAIHRRYGLAMRLCFLVITINQFHYLFYASRFIPNTYAAILANLVFASWIDRHYSKSLWFMALCVVIFRFDTAIFFGWILLDAIFIKRTISLGRVLTIGIPAGLFSLILTIIVDSIFWNRPVWPEFEGLYFNVWLNKSNEWGVEPFFWYVYNCIPRIMLTYSLLPLVGYNKLTRDYLIPVLLFIASYSLLPHKELRFILFITPLLNLCAASGMMNIYYFLNKQILHLMSLRKTDNSGNLSHSQQNRRSKSEYLKQHQPEGHQQSLIAKLVFVFIVIGMITANLFCSFILTRVSSHNYPGGTAALSLGVNKELLDGAKQALDSNILGNQHFKSNVAVYVSNLAAQTGVSRFIQVDGVYYSKTPRFDNTTFTSSYQSIYLILEPHEVKDYMNSYCPSLRNSYKPDQFKDEIKCLPPNQQEMFCSVLESVESFKSVNIGGLLRQIRQIRSIESFRELFFGDSKSYIKTKIALQTLRCSTKSDGNK